MSKVTDLKLTCEAYPESNLLITGIDGELFDKESSVKQYTVYAVLNWERNAKAIDYIPIETKVTLHGLDGLTNEGVTGLVTGTQYDVQRAPKLVAVFYL